MFGYQTRFVTLIAYLTKLHAKLKRIGPIELLLNCYGLFCNKKKTSIQKHCGNMMTIKEICIVSMKSGRLSLRSRYAYKTKHTKQINIFIYQ